MDYKQTHYISSINSALLHKQKRKRPFSFVHTQTKKEIHTSRFHEDQFAHGVYHPPANSNTLLVIYLTKMKQRIKY